MTKLILTVICLFGLQTAFASEIPFFEHVSKSVLSDAARNQLIQRVDDVLKNPYIPKSVVGSNDNYELPPRAQLGMNGVPVFDQGWEWATCATFAVTTAIDAFYGLKGDQLISQTCYLQVARSLTPPDIGMSWWEGGSPFYELLSFEHYGFWTFKDQNSIKIDGKPACGGLDKYPASSNSIWPKLPKWIDADDLKQQAEQQRTQDGGNGEAMSVSVYQQHSKPILKNSDWHVISSDPTKQPEEVLQQIKSTLAHGGYIIFSTYVDAFLSDHLKNMGALGVYNGFVDTWILTNQLAIDLQAHPNNVAEHKMVIFGYADDAYVTFTDEGIAKRQWGLLKIRNSIGEEMGDHGNFYMTYDYFRAAVASSWVIAIGGTVPKK